MLRRRMRSERGAAIVEFALVVPILILLVFGIVEFGRVFYIQSTISGAAREGARAMALGDSDAEARARAQDALGSVDAALDPKGACPDPPGPNPPNAVFEITYDFVPVTKIINIKAKLTGRGVMRCNG